MKMPTHIVAAGSFTEDNEGNLLMVKVPRKGWVFPGGQVEEGENLINALVREVKEESGIDVDVGKLVVVSSNTKKYNGHSGVKIIPTKVMFDFICKPLGGALDISDETTESGWFPKDKIMDMIKSPTLKERYKAYLEFNGTVRYLEYITRPDFILKGKRNI